MRKKRLDHVPDPPSSDTGLTGVLLVHTFLPVKEESLHPANCVIGDTDLNYRKAFTMNSCISKMNWE